MPTQIIDNFDLNTAKPLDNRLVVGPNSFYTTKDSITYKYEGMRVWDINDGVPYVWTGTTFSSENNIAVTGTGIQNYLAKFGAASNVIGTSQVFDNGTNVGLGTSTPSYKLDVNGRIRTYGAVNGFVGDGSLITGLNATNINAGLMGIQYLQGGNTGWILTADNASSTTYKNPTTINVGSATTLQTSRSFWGQSFNGSANVSGNITGAGTIQFGTQTSKATLTYTTNTPRLLTVPNLSGDRTFAFINESQTFSAAQTISGNSGTLLTVNRSANGNNYTFFSTTGPNNVGIFFQNSGSARSLYMDSSGNLITGGNSPYTSGFSNIQISSTGTTFVNPIKIGTKGVSIKTHVSGYVKFTRNSDGTGFSYSGQQRGGVTGVTDISPSGSSFVGTAGLILVRIAFPANTFQGVKDDNVVFAQFGLDDTSGNIFQLHKSIQGKVVSTNEIDIRMDFPPTPAAGYDIRLNFIVQSL